MSGIMGIYYSDGRPIEKANIESMLNTLAHRGMDGADLLCFNSVGLGHRMLWTTPESLSEKLPLYDKSNNLAITADARIDNREELIHSLELSSFPKEKITDSQLILKAYQKWGDRCPEKLIGDFAFAIWDERKQQLFCARDVMGVKPFYYYYSDKVFVFASEIKALFCSPEVPRQLNELKIAYYLEMFYEERTDTFYQNIFRLPAANYLIINPSKKIQLKSYWSLDPKREIRFSSQSEYTEAFREVFFEAVNCRLRSAFPIGSTLSGGLDSSSIACTARQLLTKSGNKKLHTFSAIFPSLPPEELWWIDERKFINAVTSLGGFEPHQVRADLLDPLVDLLWQDDEPIAAFNLYMHQGLYQCANQQGVRVFIDGIDGDSTISHGWTYLTELAYTGRWNTLIKEINTVSRRYRLSRKVILRKYVMEPLFIQPCSYFWQGLQRIAKTTKHDNALLNTELAKKVTLAEQMQIILKAQPNFSVKSKQVHYLSLTTGLHQFVLETTDKTAANFALEARYPFFDRRLMEFCLALPSEQKFSQGWSRYILRQAMTDVLPTNVQWRISKGRLGFNFRRKLMDLHKNAIDDTVKETPVIEKYVDLKALNTLYQRYVFESKATDADSLSIFISYVFALWLKEFEQLN